MDDPGPSTSAVDGLDHAGSPSRLRTRRSGYAAFSAGLALLMVVTVADGLSLVDAFGVDTVTASATAGATRLEVDHPSVARPGLAAPLVIEVSDPAGFAAPITVAVSRTYIGMWDWNAMLPEPSGQTVDGDRVVFEFDPPDGDVLVVRLDGRIEPGVQSARAGEIALLDDAGADAAVVEVRTRVMP
jgi:hypothetical protein